MEAVPDTSRDDVASLVEQAQSIRKSVRALVERLTERNTARTIAPLVKAAESAAIAEQLLVLVRTLPDETPELSGEESQSSDSGAENGQPDESPWTALFELFLAPWRTPAPQVNLMENQTERSDESCCVTDEPCQSNNQHSKTPAKKPVLPADSVVPTIFIAPGTDEYLEGDQPLQAGDADKSKPVPPIEDRLPKAQPNEAVEDPDQVLTCVVVPSRKDLASTLLSGARRFLGFADTSLKEAEENYAGECCDLESGECGPKKK